MAPLGIGAWSPRPGLPKKRALDQTACDQLLDALLSRGVTAARLTPVLRPRGQAYEAQTARETVWTRCRCLLYQAFLLRRRMFEGVRCGSFQITRAQQSPGFSHHQWVNGCLGCLVGVSLKT